MSFVFSLAFADDSCGFNLDICGPSNAEYGRRYYNGAMLCSRSKEYQFGIAADGNLVLCKNNKKIWGANTCCEEQNPFLQHNKGGSVVVYGTKPNGNQIVLWSSGTGNIPDTILSVRNNGVARISSQIDDEVVYWRTKDSNNNDFPISNNAQNTPEGDCGFHAFQCSHIRAEYGREYYNGDILCSKNGEIQFGIAHDGNLVICRNNVRIWAANTCCGRHDPYFQHNQGGNVVVYGTEFNGEKVVLWTTGTSNTPDSTLFVGNNGVVKVLSNDESVWESNDENGGLAARNTPTAAPLLDELGTCSFGGTRCMGQSVGLRTTLLQGDHICSPSKRFTFGIDSRGYVVLCDLKNAKWVKTSKNTRLILQGDGNLVIRKNGNVQWSTKTFSRNVKHLKIYNNGAVQLEKGNGASVWSVVSSDNNVLEFDDNSSSSDGSDDPGQTYVPGQLIYDKKNNLFLSKGLTARRFGKTGERIRYPNGDLSRKVHKDPDGGACFDSTDGSFIYVSNEEEQEGGVGAFKFNSEGEVIDYKMILTGTKVNCGGGKSPWGTWLTGEEASKGGHFWEVHPTGSWKQKTKIGGESGAKFESAAFDARDMRDLKVFATCDSSDGELRRFIPNPTVLNAAVDSGNYKKVLSTEGTIDYLVLTPTNARKGFFRWTRNKSAGMRSAQIFFPNVEGIDHHDGLLFFVSKERRMLFILDLDKMTYTMSSTSFGKFNGQPDQILHSIDPYSKNGMIYFTEDGGDDAAGIYAKDHAGNRHAILTGGEGLSNESTGFAICDKGRKMIMAFQDGGELYVISRNDGKTFQGEIADLKYHDSIRQSVFS